MNNQTLRSLAISLAALGLLAGPAWSARVVEIRVGDHPTFTRVVFELDAKAGYEIEQHDAEGGQLLVVTLSAASQPRKIASRSPMVASIEVEPSGQDAVARIRLRRSAPLVKELILGSPPRIVLDLMLPEEMARRAPTPKAGRTGPATAKATSEPAPRGVADGVGKPTGTAVAKTPEAGSRPETTRPEEPERTPQAGPSAAKPPAVASKPARPPAEVGAAPKHEQVAPEQKAKPEPFETAIAPKAFDAPTGSDAAKVPEARTAPAPGTPGASEPREQPAPSGATPDVPGPAARGEKTPSDGESATPKSGEPGEVAAGEAAPATPLPPVARPPETRPAKPAARAPTSPTPSTAKSGERFFGFRLSGSDPWLTVGVVGAAAIFFLLVVALLLRKHSRRTSLDALESSREPIDSGDAFTTLGAGTDLGTPRETYPAAGPGLFDDESEKGDMDMAAQIPIERTRMTPPPGADVESAPPVRDLERRMTQLESRLDQVNEARERLERQVAAQSEELRVQRAAIARTQRALRGMTRSGDEATEPALRDPAKPPPGRV